jgi:hypothetical protein
VSTYQTTSSTITECHFFNLAAFPYVSSTKYSPMLLDHNSAFSAAYSQNLASSVINIQQGKKSDVWKITEFFFICKSDFAENNSLFGISLHNVCAHLYKVALARKDFLICNVMLKALELSSSWC